MTIGTKIYEYRKKAGMTQEELAERLGVSRQAVSKWESDYAIPETEKILEMCRLFNVSADELLLDGAPSNEQSAPRKDYGFIKHSGLHFEYISKTKVRGTPLLHVNFGFCHCRAKGIFAFGNVATGIVAGGLLSVGLLSFGLLSIGLLAFGPAAIGLLFAAGAVAAGTLAFGGVAVGVMCFGGFSAGYFAVGGAAFGQYAAGGYAKGFLAAGQSGVSGKHAFLMPDEFSMLKEYVSNYLNNPLAKIIVNIAQSLK